MCVFFDTECTQEFEKTDGSFEHIPKLICAQQICCKCEAVVDLSVDFTHCGKRTHVFWAEDHVGKLINSGSLDHLRIGFMLFHTALVNTTHSFYCKNFWK